MPITKTAGAAVIARGSVSAATASIPSISVTRSGTTATATSAAAHGRSTGDKLLIQGFEYVQYNGIFTITVTSATTFTYIISSDPGANSASASGTAWKVVLGTLLDIVSAYETTLFGQAQNFTGVTVPAEIWIGYSNTANEYDVVWSPLMTLDTTGFSAIPIQITPDPGFRYINIAIGKNTGGSVGIFVLSALVTGV